MDSVRNEATSIVASQKMNDVQDETLPRATSYHQGKKVFERANGFKTINFDGNVSSVDSMCHGRVRDRKKFFEHHIIEQQQREKGLLSPPPPSSASPAMGLSARGDSAGPSFTEERTDSESFLRNKGDKFEPERKGSRSTVHSKSERIGPAESTPSEIHQKWESRFDSRWDTEPGEFFEQESSHNLAKEMGDQRQESFNGKESIHSVPTTGTTETSDSYIKKVKSLDAKILSLPSLADAEIEEKEEEEEHFSRGDTREGIEQTGGMQRDSEGRVKNNELVRIKNKPNRPTVKIQVTKTRAENKNQQKFDEQKDAPSKTSDLNLNFDEMITDFQQASATFSGEWLNDSSSENTETGSRSGGRPNLVEINHDDEVSQVDIRDDTGPADEILADNTLTANDFNELNEKLHATQRKGAANSHIYVCPSESTDYSIDSKGNSKATKSTSSKSAKSAKASMKPKAKSNGMGRMLKKAKKGMGKSVKNLTSIVKNTMKTKPTKQSFASTEQVVERISDEKKCIQLENIFDQKLAIGLVKESADMAGIVKAVQYLDSGNRLLRRKAELKKTNDPKKAKELIQKAHTYAYVGRQLAKQYLLVCRREHLEGTGQNPTNCTSAPPSQNDDVITVFEEFFFSFMQCVGPCTRDDAIEQSRVQVSDTLEILSNLSEEEASVVKHQSSKGLINKKVVVDRKMKVQEAIADTRNSADRGHVKSRTENAYRERSLAIHSFVQALRSFYEIDDTMKLSQIFLKFSPDERDDASDSSSYLSDGLSYNYSESLKFDNGRSFHTRSFTSEGSMEQEKASSRRGRKSKDESLAEGIHPGTTVVAISVKNRNFKKKKQTPSKKWGRKQK